MNRTAPEHPDAEDLLIRKASSGDLVAFNQLISCYANLAYHLAYALLGDAASADAVTRESFLKASREIGGFRRGSFQAWLLRIVTRTAWSRMGRSKQRAAKPKVPKPDQTRDVGLPTPTPYVEPLVKGVEGEKRISRLLWELSATQRGVIILVDTYGLGYREVAEIFNIPRGAVKRQLARARLLICKRTLRIDPFFPENGYD